MTERRMMIVLLTCLGVWLSVNVSAQQPEELPITIRPATLADMIEELAGRMVIVPYARVVGVINPRVLVIDTAAFIRPVLGNRDRVVVLVSPGALRVSRPAIVGSTVKVLGVARTLLSVQVTREVDWPRELRPNVVDRLEIRAAIVANSVQTADGVELTSAGGGD